MLITKLKSKIHRAVVTETNLLYEGSCAIDSALLESATIEEHEMIHIYNVNTGDRFSTYAIPAEPGSGIISVRGSAARKAAVGDILIICTFGIVSQHQDIDPIVVYVDDYNREKPIPQL